MSNRISKFVVGGVHVTLLVILLHALFGVLPMPRAVSFAVLSLFWMILTSAQMTESLAAYEDRMLRRMIYIPLGLGVLLAGASLVMLLAESFPARDAALLKGITSLNLLGALIGWRIIYRAYRATRAKYSTVGSGYLPNGTWINPAFEAIPNGAIILTDGRMARRARNSVGHSELVVKDKEGKLRVASSYIEKGVVMHLLKALIVTQLKNKENYIVLVPREPWSDEQSARAFELAEALKVNNKAWRAKENERRTRLFNFLPMPARLHKWLLAKAMSTGYDVIGKYWGGYRKDRYTCMAANLLVLRGAGVAVGEYGTGAFGLVGEVNPMVPIRLMKDPAYRVLTTNDQAVFEMRKSRAVEPPVA